MKSTFRSVISAVLAIVMLVVNFNSAFSMAIEAIDFDAIRSKFQDGSISNQEIEPTPSPTATVEENDDLSGSNDFLDPGFDIPEEFQFDSPQETFPELDSLQENPDLILRTDQEYVIPGEEFSLSIELSDLAVRGDIIIEPSPGLTPQGEYMGEIKADDQSLRFSAQKQSSVTWQADVDTEGPYYFYVRVEDDDGIVAENWMGLDQAVRGTADQMGGVIAWENRGITVLFPEGAVDQEVDLLIRQAIVNSIAPFNLSGNSMIIEASSKDGKAVETFLKDLTLEIRYDPGMYEGNESTLFISYYNEEKEMWEVVPTLRDTENKIVSATISHLSEWDLSVGSWEATRLPSLGNFSAQDYTGGSTFNLPIDLPLGPGGFQPELSLSYNSTTVDGVNLYTQAGWAGMGWNMNVGAIVRNQHGTADYTIDDTFILDFGDSGGLLIAEQTDPAENKVRYYLQNEDFRKIEYFKGEDVWVVWDKFGTRYVFGGYYDASLTLWNDEMSGAFYPAGCDGSDAIHPTWYWGLKQIINKYDQRMDITWERTNRTLSDYCGTGTLGYLVMDTKPVAIYYPDNSYRILFETTSNRKDRDPSWSFGIVFYTQKNLDRIRIQENQGGQWVDAWSYDLVYAQDKVLSDPNYSNVIFPEHELIDPQDNSFWGLTLTLVEVQKCYEQGSCDPAYSFEYSDGMHITAAENGQGGRIEYTYDRWYETQGPETVARGSDSLCGRQGELGTYGWSGSCNSYSDVWFLHVITSSNLGITSTNTRPGSYYKFDTRVSVQGHGDPSDWFRTQLTVEGSVASQSDIITLYNSVWAPANYTFFLYNNPSWITDSLSAVLYGTGLEYCPDTTRVCHGFAAFGGKVRPVLTKYRVIEKTVIDLVSNDETVYSYTYDGYATNNAEYSEIVANSSTQCGWATGDSIDYEAGCYSTIFGEFRGHSSTTVTDPSGRTTINYYHQDDVLQGKQSASMTVVSQYGDSFEAGLDTNQWLISLSGGDADAANVTRYYGDNALYVKEGEVDQWSSVLGDRTIAPDGSSMLIQFRPQAGSQFTIGVADPANPNSAWRIFGDDAGLSAQYGDGSSFITASTLIDIAGGYEPDAWYVAAFTLDHDAGYSIRVWKQTDPSVNGFYQASAASCNFGSTQVWQFAGSVNNGTLYIDEYMEADIYSLDFTFYDYETNPNGITVDPPNYYRWAMGPFPGFNVYWIHPDASESYVFEGGSAFQATRTEYYYETTSQGGAQYGNLTGTLEQFWNGTGWESVRQRAVEYFPNDTTSVYLTGFPGVEKVYDCVGGVCDQEAQDLLSITQSIYDGNTAYNQPPTLGEAIRVRQGVDRDAGTIYWADTLMDYDAWGNQTSVTQYTDYGTDAAYASQGAQTTTTAYDATHHTYPVTVSLAIAGHQTTLTYDTRLGLPEAMTDHNGLVTLLCYDTRARLVGMVKGDVADPPTCSSQMEMTVIYHESVETAGVWTPFWTEASQVLSLDGQGLPDLEIAYRKFYDGIGRQIQTQIVGVDLDGFADGSQTIVTDLFYNPNGQLEYTSMPYNIATPVGYATPAACTTGTCIRTLYDALGREIETQSPDGAVVQTLYGFDAAASLRTVTVTDPNQNTTTSYQDVWGQTVQVMPITGPWMTYSYDRAGQLTQVDQVNATGVFASTYMAYDLGGRKLEMSDLDMGVWTYDYDALGNLVTQVGANQQQINLCYDDLNRLTGKFYGTSGDCSAPAGWDVTYYYDDYSAGMFTGFTGPTAYGLGQRTGMLDGSGQTIWSYDQRGNLTLEEKLVGADTFTTQWAYSVGGLTEHMVYPEADGTTEDIFYTYHPQGSVSTVSSSPPLPAPPTEESLMYLPFLFGGYEVQLTLSVPELTTELPSIALAYPVTSGTDSLDPVTDDLETDPLEGVRVTLESVDDLLISITYDEAGRVVNRTYSDSGDGLQTNFDYYDWNEQINTIPQGGLLEMARTGTLADTDSLVSLAYIYDAVGNVATISDLIQAPAQTQTFAYDDLYRLTGAAGTAGFGGAYTESYVYDDLGRMDEKDGAGLNYGAARTGICQTNTLTPAASSTVTHAVSSKTGGNTYTYDCNGNAISRGDQTLIYDEENRLVEVQVSGVTVAEYIYDGDGNRVQSVVAEGDLTLTTVYIGAYYEQITTVDANVSPAVVTTEWKKYYYAGSVRLAMREDNDDPLYIIGDHLGSTLLVVDTSGQEVAKRTYLPFGGIWDSSVAELPTDFTYTGQREAPEIGLHYYVARWYDSEIGHFIQADTIVPGAGSALAWNRYAYVNYSPMNYNDPTGHFAFCLVLAGAAVGSAISYGIQVYNNYQNGYEGTDAWTQNISADPIVFGALLGAGAVLTAPVAAAAAGDALVGIGIVTGSTAMVVAGNTAYGASQTLADIIVPIDYPTLEIDSGSMPNIAQNIQNAQNNGAPSLLTRTTDQVIKNGNRALATRGFTGIGPGLSADEYPFASTYQGGEGAFIRIVPIREQWIQGGTLAHFYNKYNLLDGDKFNVIIK